METQCIGISTALKNTIRGTYFSHSINERLKSIRGMIARISRTHLQSMWMNKLLTSLNLFIKNLERSNSNNVFEFIKNIENEILSCMVADLNIPAAFYTSIL